MSTRHCTDINLSFYLVFNREGVKVNFRSICPLIIVSRLEIALGIIQLILIQLSLFSVQDDGQLSLLIEDDIVELLADGDVTDRLCDLVTSWYDVRLSS